MHTYSKGNRTIFHELSGVLNSAVTRLRSSAKKTVAPSGAGYLAIESAITEQRAAFRSATLL